MFWLGFAVGVVATFTFLMTEHLLGQLALAGMEKDQSLAKMQFDEEELA
jgi:hypothetical protein